MSPPGDTRLQRLLGGEHLAALRQRLRRRFAYAPIDRPLQHIRLDGLSAEEHAALASLTGRPQRYAASMRVDVGQVDAAFRQAGIAASLRAALEQLDGPIVHLTALRLRQQDAWARLVDDCRNGPLSAFLQMPAGLGLLKRLARQDADAAIALCRAAEAVLHRLPAPGIARAQLAAEVLGDAHALDNGRPVATLVLAARRRLGAEPRAGNDVTDAAAGTDDQPDAQPAPERARELWAAAGVLVNELARPALFLNLPVAGAHAPVRGEPCYASLRSLVRDPPTWAVAQRDVHVCENPNLLAIAADRLGSGCAPLVCTEGMPAAAQRILLRQLAQAGARLLYHGDFDWPGVRIANHMIAAHGALPWRLGAADYRHAVQGAPSRQRTLHGQPVLAAWDPDLTADMQQHGIAVPEEALADVLLHDLRRR